MQQQGPPAGWREGPNFKPTEPQGHPFGTLVRKYRVRLGFSQNLLARRAGVDPAYVNRLERAPEGSTATPSRKVVLALWEALEGGDQDRERLLVAAGLVPEVILRAGGWDAYLTKVRGAFSRVFDDVNQALTVVDNGPNAVQDDGDLP